MLFTKVTITDLKSVKVDNESENHISEYVLHEVSFKTSTVLSGIQEQEGQHSLHFSCN